MVWDKMILKAVILRTEIPMVLKVISEVCENKCYDWKYLWILIRNDLNTSGRKCFVCYRFGMFHNWKLWRVRDRWHIFDMCVLGYLMLYRFEKDFVLNPEGNLFWYERIYYFKCLKGNWGIGLKNYLKELY